MKIQDKRENNSILLDEHGLLCREYLPYEGEYSPKQLKIINSGMFLTKDNWENVEAAIGEFTYTDPATGDEKTVYGVLAQALIAPLVLTSDIGVFNEDGTVNIDKNGLTIVDTGTGTNSTKFRLKRKLANGTVSDVIYFDSNGNAHFAGALDAATGTFTGTMTANCIQGGVLTLGGVGNINGYVRMLNSGGQEYGKWAYDGLHIGPAYNFVKLLAQVDIDGDGSLTWVPFYSKSSGNDGFYDEIYINEGCLYFKNTFDDGYVKINCRGMDMERGNVMAGIDGITGEMNLTGSLTADGGLYTSGNLQVGGTKSRYIETDQYSKRLLYCYETPSPLFGDLGEGVIGEDGKCYVWLDPVFAQTIANGQYQVFLQAYGDGKCWVSERHPGYFIVEGSAGMEFAWELKAKQIDSGNARLELLDRAKAAPSTDYGAMAVQHIREIKEERDMN